MLAAPREDVADAASVLTSGEGFEPMHSYLRWHAYVSISSRRSLEYFCIFWSLSALACLDNTMFGLPLFFGFSSSHTQIPCVSKRNLLCLCLSRLCCRSRR